MVKWKKIGEVCKSVTPPEKLTTGEYQSEGLYPIIDQGQKDENYQNPFIFIIQLLRRTKYYLELISNKK